MRPPLSILCPFWVYTILQIMQNSPHLTPKKLYDLSPWYREMYQGEEMSLVPLINILIESVKNIYNHFSFFQTL